MAIYMTARFRVRPESAEKCRQAIAEFVEYVRQYEAGTQLYVSLQETNTAANFLHLFVFQDQAAREHIRIRRPSSGLRMCSSLRRYRRWSSLNIRW